MHEPVYEEYSDVHLFGANIRGSHDISIWYDLGKIFYGTYKGQLIEIIMVCVYIM